MRQIKGITGIYSRKVRDHVNDAGKKILVREGLEIILPEFFACVDELIKNAVKANYKFLLLRERMENELQMLWPDKNSREIKEDIDDLIKIPESFNRLAEEVLKKENISTTVRDILNEESKLIAIKNKAYLENREYNEPEKQSISGLMKINDIRAKIRERNVKIIWTIQADSDFIYITVLNTAPILTRDLDRIHEKLDEYRHCRDMGKEYEFFINNIDTSESGFGLGFAKIDAILNNWGLAGERNIMIISAIDTTVMLTLPLDILKKTLLQANGAA
jgi:hypothetical protein